MKEKVTPLKVAKYYLTVELGKPFQKKESKLKLKTFIDSLEIGELWKLLKLVSEEYRKNGVFQLLTNPQHKSYEKVINIKNIKLGDVNENVKKYLILAEYDPLKFKDLLIANKDVGELKEFQPQELTEEESIFIFTHDEGTYKIVDGIHRLMSLVQQGIHEVKGYILS